MQIFNQKKSKYFYKKILLLIILAIAPLLLPAQVDNTPLFEPLQFEKDTAKKLYLCITNLNFMRNNEYFTPIVAGQTYFGYQFAPSLVYYPTKRIRIEAGAFVRKDFGNPDYTQIAPIFSFRYQKDSTSITVGNLEGNVQHQLIEPLYAFERLLTNHLENGFQFKHQKRRIRLDAWVDWQQATYPQAAKQEFIWAGINTEIPLLKTTKKNKLLACLQATTFHNGGQDLNVNLPATNSFQLAGGLKYTRQKWHAEAYYVRAVRETYQDTNLVVRTGNAFYAQVGGKFKWFDAVISFWQGEGIDNALGSDLYKSYPTHQRGYAQAKRQLIIFRFAKTWKLAPSIYLTARLEPYYDIVNKRLEQSQMLFISFRPTFGLR